MGYNLVVKMNPEIEDIIKEFKRWLKARGYTHRTGRAIGFSGWSKRITRDGEPLKKIMMPREGYYELRIDYPIPRLHPGMTLETIVSFTTVEFGEKGKDHWGYSPYNPIKRFSPKQNRSISGHRARPEDYPKSSAAVLPSWQLWVKKGEKYLEDFSRNLWKDTFTDLDI